ncbi:MAG: class E sortase [Actinobacteria bacterium]|nr:class E sortase [Actinomycetota bacterium]
MKKRIGLVFILIGIIIILFPYITNLYAYQQQAVLKKQFNASKKILRKTKTIKKTKIKKPHLLRKSKSARKLKLKKSRLFKIIIPKIGLNSIVLEGATSKNLSKGPARLTESFPVGENGNSVITGHRVSYGAPFRRLDQLNNGDEIFISTPERDFKYVVFDKKIVDPKNIGVLASNGEPKLTLTTCSPIYSARERLVIMARLF